MRFGILASLIAKVLNKLGDKLPITPDGYFSSLKDLVSHEPVTQSPEEMYKAMVSWAMAIGAKVVQPNGRH